LEADRQAIEVARRRLAEARGGVTQALSHVEGAVRAYVADAAAEGDAAFEEWAMERDVTLPSDLPVIAE
jgi:hypothetical protein